MNYLPNNQVFIDNQQKIQGSVALNGVPIAANLS